MKSLLQDLYYGKVSPWERRAPANREMLELNQKIDSEERYFVQKMSAEDVQRFEKLIDLYAQSGGFAEFDAFACGLSLGVGLMIEALAEN